MMEKKEQKTVDQHYVPRFYLKKFSIIKGTGEKEKVLTSFFQFDKNLLKDNIPTKSICYEKYFYGEDGKIEQDFAGRETKWSVLIQSIVDMENNSLDSIQKKGIKQFAVYQFSRTLAMYKYSKDTMNEMMLAHLLNNVKDIEGDIVRKAVEEKTDMEIEVADIIKHCEELIEVIDDLDISIVKFSTLEKLITSDMPVIVMNPFCNDEAGFANMGVVILFPVSPEMLILIYDGKVYHKCKEFMVNSNEEDVKNLNKYQVMSAEERILAKDRKQLEAIVINKELISMRNDYRESRKVNSSFDGRGTLVATKSRSMHYNFEISFLHLPRYLKKIPKDCRAAFNRRYSFEARLNLLISMYRVPELMKNNPDIPYVNIAERKAGYTKMQRYMDDYWKIPMADRTITPEMMKKIKTIEASWFPIN